MVTVVVRGALPESIKYTSHCGNCKSILEFYKAECRTVHDRDGLCYILKCPVCSKDIYISSTALKPVIQSTDFRDQPFEPK